MLLLLFVSRKVSSLSDLKLMYMTKVGDIFYVINIQKFFLESKMK